MDEILRTGHEDAQADQLPRVPLRARVMDTAAALDSRLEPLRRRLD